MTQIQQQYIASHSVAEAILEQLRLWGVERIYGVIGDAIFGLMDAIARQKSITFIAVKHESVAAMMASAEAKYTGKLGVCVAQMGPGLANLINGLGDAYLDGSPLLAITGQAPLKHIGTTYKQYINQQMLVQAVSGYSELIVHPDAILKSLTKAIQVSYEMETVSHISIPADVFTMQTLVKLSKPTLVIEKDIQAEQLQHASHMMHAARSPMILIGNRVRPLTQEIQQLAEIWGAGIAVAYGATGIVLDSEPNVIGGIGEGGNPLFTPLFKQSDVVLAIGTSWWPEGQIPLHAKVIQIQEKQMKLGNGMPVDCGIVGNAKEIISQFINELHPYEINDNWVDQIHNCKQSWSSLNEQEGNISEYPIHPSRIMRDIEKYVTPNTIIALDEGDSTLWFMRNFRAQCEHVLLSSRWRTMGFGLPAALAAKLCEPNKQVICITGDGGIAMVLADLLTAVRYQLQITVIVLNNGALQMEENKMNVKGFIPEGTKLTNPNYTYLAQACGWDAYTIHSTDEFGKRLDAALNNEKPTLLEVPTAKNMYPNYQSS